MPDRTLPADLHQRRNVYLLLSPTSFSLSRVTLDLGNRLVRSTCLSHLVASRRLRPVTRDPAQAPTMTPNTRAPAHAPSTKRKTLSANAQYAASSNVARKKLQLRLPSRSSMPSGSVIATSQPHSGTPGISFLCARVTRSLASASPSTRSPDDGDNKAQSSTIKRNQAQSGWLGKPEHALASNRRVRA
jgi:hypothetical protein